MLFWGAAALLMMEGRALSGGSAVSGFGAAASGRAEEPVMLDERAMHWMCALGDAGPLASSPIVSMPADNLAH